MDWCVINHAFKNTFWAFEGGVVELQTVAGDGDGEQRGDGPTAQGGIGVAKEVKVRKKHDGTVGVIGVWANYIGKWRHKAKVAVRDWVFVVFFV